MDHSKASTYDINGIPRNPVTIDVNSRGMIIAGLEVGNTVCIHHADGQLKSKFTTPASPWWLAVTSKDDIVIGCTDDSLRLIDISGNIIRVLQPPQGVNVWKPRSLCCSEQGEIFVRNEVQPQAIYRYTADGVQCLGCVVTGLDSPVGLGVTDDGQQLLVAEHKQHVIKRYQRK